MGNSALTNAEWWIRVLTTVRNVSALLVAIGVAGEFLGDWLSAPYQKTIDDVRAGAIASANERALASELALAKIRTPRSLSHDQADAFVLAMTSFKGVPFDFSIQPNSETIKLMTEIGDCLMKAGLLWKPFSEPNAPVFTQPGFPQAGIVAFSGLAIQYNSDKTSEWEKPAGMIVGVLRAFGLETEGTRVIDGTVKPNAIHIYVGEKPL